ncbi:hypothetical protein [Loigolactobacillus backii]|nr:hypothetical protein [Loigolactobacillus backii]
MMDEQKERENAMKKAYAERLTAIEADADLTILEKQDRIEAQPKKITPYIVYTNLNRERFNERSCSVFVYTPYANVDKYGHSKTDYQSELLFEYSAWDNEIHMTVLETLGSESQLAFYDFQNHGMAQLAIINLLKIARKINVTEIEGNVSSFDGEGLKKVIYLLSKFGFTFDIQDKKQGLASFKLKLE